MPKPSGERGILLGVPSLKSLKVEIIAERNGTGVSYRIKESDHAKGNKIKVPDDGGYKIHFDLDPENGLDVRFDASAPFFVRDGGDGDCPTCMDSKQIMVDSCDNDDLVIIDWNTEKGDLKYQLNFVNEVGKRLDPFDPIIENGGGGVPPFTDFE